jgi:uroporphyrinogen-III synthase
MREILVIREKDVFTSILIENGFSVLNFPTIKTETVSDLSELDGLLKKSKLSTEYLSRVQKRLKSFRRN